MREEDYENQEVIKILKDIKNGYINYLEAYELLEVFLL